jgi:hypothetical protein
MSEPMVNHTELQRHFQHDSSIYLGISIMLINSLWWDVAALLHELADGEPHGVAEAFPTWFFNLTWNFHDDNQLTDWSWLSTYIRLSMMIINLLWWDVAALLHKWANGEPHGVAEAFPTWLFNLPWNFHTANELQSNFHRNYQLTLEFP